MQEEHDGLEEGRSDPEGRGAHGPARPDVRPMRKLRIRLAVCKTLASRGDDGKLPPYAIDAQASI